MDDIDKCIKNYNDEALTLRFLSRRLGYSEFYTTRKFKVYQIVFLIKSYGKKLLKYGILG